MFLYTLVPAECFLEQPETVQQAPRQLHNGASILEGRVVDGAFTVSRLISTDPKLYLDPRYTPGAVCKEELHQQWK